jgi:hypothetical protein
MTLGYRDQLFTNKLNGSLGISYAGYGAIGSDDNVGNFMEWDANYVEFNFGLDYVLYKIKETSIYIKGTTSTAFLAHGTQTLNNKVINLKDAGDFNITIFNFRIGLGISQPLSETLSVYAQYMYGKSSNMAAGNQTLKIASNNVGFGLLINVYD